MTPKDAKPLTVTCSVQVLEDVLPGDDGKHCECEIILGSAFHKGLNPMWLPEDWSGEEPGERTIPLETMRQLMEARVDPRKYFPSAGAQKGWTKRAFLNYFAGPPDGKHAKMTEAEQTIAQHEM
ncbi:Apocytochrome f, partial [Durusdinium trenchii]